MRKTANVFFTASPVSGIRRPAPSAVFHDLQRLLRPQILEDPHEAESPRYEPERPFQLQTVEDLREAGKRVFDRIAESAAGEPHLLLRLIQVLRLVRRLRLIRSLRLTEGPFLGSNRPRLRSNRPFLRSSQPFPCVRHRRTASNRLSRTAGEAPTGSNRPSSDFAGRQLRANRPFRFVSGAAAGSALSRSGSNRPITHAASNGNAPGSPAR